MNSIIKALAKIKSNHRKGLLFFADLILISVSYLLTWMMLNGRISLTEYRLTLLVSWAVFVVIFSAVFWIAGMYESLWRYAEAYEFAACLGAAIVSTIIFTIVTWIFIRPPYFNMRIPISIYFLASMLASMTTLYLRMFYRVYRSTVSGRKHGSKKQKVLLVGAGNTGNMILQELQREPNGKYEIVCIVDDDKDKIGRRIRRIKVVGSTNDIPKLAQRYGVEVIILAIPGASNRDMKRISKICAKTKCQLKKVPAIHTLVTSNTPIVPQISDVSVEDLLGREVVNIRMNKGENYLTNKIVMVTGGGGSIGSELCRQIALHSPKQLIIVDVYENNAYYIQQELLRKYHDKLNLIVEIASVRDSRKMDVLFNRYRPQIVYHAAAHKHVPLMETAPEEAVKNNVYGTLNVVKCADKYKTQRFVMISSDKAVNPTNIMGATKRVAEMIIQSMNQSSQTEFVAVRFGNVLGSNGSVIPLFKDQIAAGGPVTVTHKEVIRYFMTIPEAVSLVLKAGEMAQGGEIFVLNMGEPVNILELAENLIRLSGYEPYKDIKILFTGLRPGEKLYEELLMEEEGLKKTPNQRIFIGEPIDISPEELFDYLAALKATAYSNDTVTLVEKLHELVPTFVVGEDVPQLKYGNKG